MYNIVIVADLIYLHCKAKVLSKLGHTGMHTVSLIPRLLGVPRVEVYGVIRKGMAVQHVQLQK